MLSRNINPPSSKFKPFQHYMMGLLERVDWEDKIPRNIRFMHVEVRIDPRLPVIASFMLMLNDGSRVWIRCKYEGVHKVMHQMWSHWSHPWSMHPLHGGY